MKLSEVKSILPTLNKLEFKLEDGTFVPPHFHVTEIGLIDKHFIDCGGKIRKEQKISFQLFTEDDFDHRLHPEKLLNIINLSQDALSIEDGDIEVEYQGNTIGKYNLSFDGSEFVLENTATACLAKDACGIPAKGNLAMAESSSSCCTPSQGCC